MKTINETRNIKPKFSRRPKKKKKNTRKKRGKNLEKT
jgi:hypothetical protein